MRDFAPHPDNPKRSTIGNADGKEGRNMLSSLCSSNALKEQWICKVSDITSDILNKNLEHVIMIAGRASCCSLLPTLYSKTLQGIFVTPDQNHFWKFNTTRNIKKNAQFSAVGACFDIGGTLKYLNHHFYSVPPRA
jgi:hypothetical protein